MNSKVPAVILAGGSCAPHFKAASKSHWRALADINGWPMARYVIRALNEAEEIDGIYVVAPPDFPFQPEITRQVASDGTLTENVSAGLRACRQRGSEYALLVTADIPFLTPEAVDSYVRQSLGAAVDCAYSAIPQEACERRFPGMKRTYLRTPDLVVTGGNVVMQRIEAFEREARVLERAFRLRKNPLFLARLIGLGNVLRFMRKTLTLRDVEAAASRMMGVRCRVLVTSYAELGSDVDKVDDLALARRMLYPPRAASTRTEPAGGEDQSEDK